MPPSVHRVALVLALIAAVGLLVPTGAAQFLPGGPTDEVSEAVTLQPTDSGHAHLDEDGDLMIDISASNPALDAEGVNAGSTSTFEDVFVIHYGGDRYAEVWLTHETDAIAFSANGAPIDSRENNVTLGPNQSVAVGLTVDAADPQAIERADEFTVHSRVAEPPDDGGSRGGGGGGGGVGGGVGDEGDSTAAGPVVEVTAPAADERVIEIRNATTGDVVDVEFDPLPLGAGTEALSLNGVTVEHGSAGDSAFKLAALDRDGNDPAVDTMPTATGLAALGTIAVTPIDGEAIDRVRLQVTASTAFLERHGTSGDALAAYRYANGQWERLPVERTTTDDGVALEIVSGVDSTVVIGAPTAVFDVTDVQANESGVTAGEAVGVTATVRNRGAASGNATLPLTLDDQTVAQRTVQLSAGEMTTLTFTQEVNQTGNHTLAVGDAPGVSVRVTPGEPVTASGAEVEPTETTATTTLVEEPAGIGLGRIGGVGIAAALALGVVLLVRRRPIG